MRIPRWVGLKKRRWGLLRKKKKNHTCTCTCVVGHGHRYRSHIPPPFPFSTVRQLERREALHSIAFFFSTSRVERVVQVSFLHFKTLPVGDPQQNRIG